MMENPLDNSRLIIKLIKSKPSLWNPQNSKFSNRHINDILWCELADEVKVTVGDLKAKWNTLRNSYARSIREDNINPNKPRTKWYLEDEMQFLKQFVQHRHKRTKYRKKSIKDEITKDSEQFITKDDDVLIINEPIIDHSNQSLTSSTSRSSLYYCNDLNEYKNEYSTTVTIAKEESNSPHLPVPIKRSKSISKSNENINQFLQLQSQQQPSSNSDNLFFQSIEIDFHKLPMKKRRKFKTATMKLINELLDETDEENGNFE